MSNIEDMDNEILNEIQWTFPLVARPFDAIAEKFNISSGVAHIVEHESC